MTLEACAGDGSAVTPSSRSLDRHRHRKVNIDPLAALDQALSIDVVSNSSARSIGMNRDPEWVYPRVQHLSGAPERMVYVVPLHPDDLEAGRRFAAFDSMPVSVSAPATSGALWKISSTMRPEREPVE